MKSKISIYLLLALMCIGLQSCLFQEEDYFEDSSANRASADVERCSEILKSVPNGWKIEYYAGKDYSLGGYTLFCKFDGKSVTMASDFGSQLHKPGEQVTSLYKVVSEQSTMLTFDTYNDLLHFFAQPNGANENYGGDYEFIIMNASADKIELQGKKYKNTMIMTPLPETTDWSAYIAAVNKVRSEAFLGGYNVMINGKNIGQLKRLNNTFNTNLPGSAIQMNIPFIYTPDGLYFREPVVIGGVTMQRFTWNAEALTFTCIDEGASEAKFAAYFPEGYMFYEDYLGNYTFDCSENNGSGAFVEAQYPVSIIQKEYNKSYILKGLDADVILDFDRPSSELTLRVQNVGRIGNYYGGLSFGSLEGYFPTYISYNTGYMFALVSKIVEGESLTIRFVDDGLFQTATGDVPTSIVFHVYSSSAYDQASFLGFWSWYDNFTLKKK